MDVFVEGCDGCEFGVDSSSATFFGCKSVADFTDALFSLSYCDDGFNVSADDSNENPFVANATPQIATAATITILTIARGLLPFQDVPENNFISILYHN